MVGFSDVIVAYLALGAPFGVAGYLRHSAAGAPRALARGTALAAVWPGVLAFWAVDRLSGRRFSRLVVGNRTGTVEREQLLESVRRRLEVVVGSARGASAAFEFREVSERYIGLAEAVAGIDHRPDPTLFADFFGTAGSPAPQTASVCLSRRSANRLRSHHARATEELLGFVRGCGRLAESERDGLLTLFGVLGDDAARSLFLGETILEAENKSAPLAENFAA